MLARTSYLEKDVLCSKKIMLHDTRYNRDDAWLAFDDLLMKLLVFDFLVVWQRTQS